MNEPKKETKHIVVRYWPIRKSEYKKDEHGKLKYPPHCGIGMCNGISRIIEERLHFIDEDNNYETSLLYICMTHAYNFLGIEADKLLREAKK